MTKSLPPTAPARLHAAESGTLRKGVDIDAMVTQDSNPQSQTRLEDARITLLEKIDITLDVRRLQDWKQIVALQEMRTNLDRRVDTNAYTGQLAAGPIFQPAFRMLQNRRAAWRDLSLPSAEREKLRRSRVRNPAGKHSEALKILHYKLRTGAKEDFQYLRRLDAAKADIRDQRCQLQATLKELNEQTAEPKVDTETETEDVHMLEAPEPSIDELIGQELHARGGKPKRLRRSSRLRKKSSPGMLNLLKEKTDLYTDKGERRVLPWDLRSGKKTTAWRKAGKVLKTKMQKLNASKLSCTSRSCESVVSVDSTVSSTVSSKSLARSVASSLSSISSVSSDDISLGDFPAPPKPPAKPSAVAKVPEVVLEAAKSLKVRFREPRTGRLACIAEDASGGQPPCGRCLKENKDCVLATSNRGGSRIRKKKVDQNNVSGDHAPLTLTASHASSAISQATPAFQRPFPPVSPEVAHPGPPTATATDHESAIDDRDADDDDDASTADSAIATAIPRNPSDAWQLLKDVATREADNLERKRESVSNVSGQNSSAPGAPKDARGSVNGVHAGIASYRLVREGYLTVDVVQMLVHRFFDNYHPYLPLVPRKYFDTSQLDAFAVNDKHLLTAVLTISSKDLIEQPHIHVCCSRYMHDLISGIAAGADCEVEAVEALLLLAEWEPQGLRNRIEAVGRGEEDRAAWMHVGIALRTGYYLSLDRTAFRSETEEEAKVDSRKRFAWANCYISDRLISCRVGKAFWSRGPGPMTGLSSRDFPSLAPVNSADEDYAKIFQATLDLVQIYTNVHDVLYSGMRTSGQMMLLGDYVKYVDDFRTGIARWNISWGGLSCSHHIKVALQMSYEYLSLYTNAFVFQAAISQAIAAKPKQEETSLRDHLKDWFSNVATMQDARFIFSSVSAAKTYLSLLSTQVDPVRHLRYMPLRYYLYGIYSAVFLYKARSFGVMDQMEERQVRQLVYHVTEVLKRASVSAQDPGSRYARLLELLWLKSPTTTSRPNATPAAPAVAQLPMSSPAAASDTQMSTGSLKMDAQGFMQFSPANEFSWLDLEAVGDFVSNDQMLQSGSNANMFSNMPDWNGAGSSFVPIDASAWGQMPNSNGFIDLNGNLLF
ncbi:uncharacterized protein AB675_2215 [Cyphellophora attinorum]|uniref:Xylanolytic transcriptional activator regulatory domain-containing protein n=1 Tax=Cyphellophora attinorum TaxID=1664694 RepID=A0A0N1H7Z1_9EURO|nr:uncharacterized protein AB675_2215 [Phialophora attinorum]KPI42797.1 hypothetical protein AB675_2215 [Phialophora attinorum]